MQSSKKRFRVLRVITTSFIIMGFGFAYWQRQEALDWWQLRDYQPSANVTALATYVTMTDKSRRIFYVNTPTIQEKADFYNSCSDGETSIVLGCYKPNDGIYILRVQDERLKGIQEVTAAHEMLHAAYGRLSIKQQKRVKSLLDTAYSNIQDQSIIDKIKLYQDHGADITNELHSILGTEVIDLPGDLEDYYSQYFSDRQVVVKYATHYQDEFTTRKNNLAELDSKLANLEMQVTSNNKSLKELKESIEADGIRLDALLKEGNIEEYNNGINTYNQSLIPFRVLLSQTQALVDEYKTILENRNAIAEEAQELSRALDSSKLDTKVNDIQ